jgi:hypothetical protein
LARGMMEKHANTSSSPLGLLTASIGCSPCSTSLRHDHPLPTPPRHPHQRSYGNGTALFTNLILTMHSGIRITSQVR